MNPNDTGFSPDHKIEHVRSYPSNAQQYRCTICDAEFICDWSLKIFVVLNFGNTSLHDKNKDGGLNDKSTDDGLLPDWVEGLDL